MAIKRFKRFLKGIVLRGESSNPNEQVEGSLYHNSTTSELGTFLDGQDRIIITNDQTQTLENKTIDADQNMISNIRNDEIAFDAEIDATKIADGSVDNNEFQALDGVTSNIQTQIDSKASQVDLDAHINNPTDAHEASAIEYDNTDSGLSADNVQDAIDELAQSAPGAGANTTLSNLESPTAINQNLLPSTNGTVDLGSNSLNYKEIHTRQIAIHLDDTSQSLRIGGDQTSPSGIISRSGILSAPSNVLGSAPPFIATSNVSTSHSSHSINLETGNTVNGNSGDIVLRPGVPSGSGTRGVIDATSALIKNVANPVDPQDAATKDYVDSITPSGTIEIKQNGTPILSASKLNFVSGATIVDGGSGEAEITISGGGGGVDPGTTNVIPKYNALGTNLINSNLSDSGTLVESAVPLSLKVNELYLKDNTTTPRLFMKVAENDSTTSMGFGFHALGNLAPAGNLAIGTLALGNVSSNGTFNIAIGNNSLAANTGSSNTAIGVTSMINNTTGEQNVAIGGSALAANTRSNRNVAVGRSALSLMNGTSGGTEGFNVAIGYQAGSSLIGGGSNNIFIGANAGPVTDSFFHGRLYINPGNTKTDTPLIYGERDLFSDNYFVRIHNYLQLPEAAEAATPASGYGVFYVKTDGNAYFKNDTGTEYSLTGGTSGANTTLSNLTSPTAINQDLIPTGSISLGSPTNRYSVIFANTLIDLANAEINTSFTSPSGASGAFFSQKNNVTSNMGICSSNKTGEAFSSSVLIESGNTVNGDSGNIIMRTGVPSGTGNRGKVTIDASQMRIPIRSSDPSSGVAGDIYYNTTTNVIRFYNGTAWSDI